MADKVHVCSNPRMKGQNLLHCDDPEHGPCTRFNIQGRKLSSKTVRSLYTYDASLIRAACSRCLTRRYRNIQKKVERMKQSFKNLSKRQKERRFEIMMQESGISSEVLLDSILSTFTKNEDINLTLSESTKRTLSQLHFLIQSRSNLSSHEAADLILCSNCTDRDVRFIRRFLDKFRLKRDFAMPEKSFVKACLLFEFFEYYFMGAALYLRLLDEI